MWPLAVCLHCSRLARNCERKRRHLTGRCVAPNVNYNVNMQYMNWEWCTIDIEGTLACVTGKWSDKMVGEQWWLLVLGARSCRRLTSGHGFHSLAWEHDYNVVSGQNLFQFLQCCIGSVGVDSVTDALISHPLESLWSRAGGHTDQHIPADCLHRHETEVWCDIMVLQIFDVDDVMLFSLFSWPSESVLLKIC